jgi:tRNA (Thr-GGU) A37 N-methylase
VERIRGASIDVRRLDMLDATPILDIKPYIEDGCG